jgi:hypothetical protein
MQKLSKNSISIGRDVEGPTNYPNSRRTWKILDVAQSNDHAKIATNTKRGHMVEKERF